MDRALLAVIAMGAAMGFGLDSRDRHLRPKERPPEPDPLTPEEIEHRKEQRRILKLRLKREREGPYGPPRPETRQQRRHRERQEAKAARKKAP